MLENPEDDGLRGGEDQGEDPGYHHHHPGPLPYLPITGLYLGYKLFIVIIIVIIKTEHRITLALFLTYQVQARIHLPENHRSPL